MKRDIPELVERFLRSRPGGAMPIGVGAAIDEIVAATIDYGADAIGPLLEALGANYIGNSHWPWFVDHVANALRGIRERTDDEQFLQILLENLYCDKPEKHAGAIVALGDVKDRRSVDSLVEVMKESDRRTQEIIVKSLGNIGDQRAFEPMFETLKLVVFSSTPGWWVGFVSTLVEALVKIGSAEDIARLTTLLDDSTQPSRRKHGEGGPSAYASCWIGAYRYVSDKNALVQMLSILQNEDMPYPMRACAISALGGIGDSRAVKPLLSMLDKAHQVYLLATVEALGRIGDQAAVGALIRVLRSKSSRAAKEHTLVALGCIGGAYAIQALVRFLLDPGALESLIVRRGGDRDDSDHRYVLRDAFVELGPHAVEPLLQAIPKLTRKLEESKLRRQGQTNYERWRVEAHLRYALTMIRSVLKGSGSTAYSGLERMKSHGDAAVRKEILDVFVSTQYPKLAQVLTECLRDPCEDVRLKAMRGLRKMEGEHAFQAQVTGLRDPCVDIRLEAVHGLTRPGNKEALQALMTSLRDPEPKIRDAAIAAISAFEDIGEVGIPSIQPLVRSLRESEEDVCVKAISILAKVGNQRAVDVLAIAMRDSRRNVRSAAAIALAHIGTPQSAMHLANYLITDRDSEEFDIDDLKKIGSPMLQALCTRMSDANVIHRRRAAQWLGLIGRASCVSALGDVLTDSDAQVRWQAAASLGRIGAKRATDYLVAALSDQEPKVRAQAATALGRVRDKKAVEALAKSLGDSESEVRCAAAIALGRVRDTSTVDSLIDTLLDPVAEVRASTATALGRIRDVKAVPPLLDVLLDPVADVRMRAAEALGGIGDAHAVDALVVALLDSDSRVCSSVKKALRKIGDPRGLEELNRLAAIRS